MTAAPLSAMQRISESTYHGTLLYDWLSQRAMKFYWLAHPDFIFFEFLLTEIVKMCVAF